jgi:hypothetical protein
MSIGSTKIRTLLLEFYGPNIRIEEEFQVGESLRLDYYLPDYHLGIEWHGRQHKVFVEHFHKDEAGFRDSQKRDRRKLELCAEQGIAVAVFWDDEVVDGSVLNARIMAAFAESNVLKKEAVAPKKDWKQIASDRRKTQYEKYKNSDGHKESLEKARTARKEQYERAKQAKHKN